DVHVRCESEADERAVISWKDPDNGVRLPFEADRPPAERRITIEVFAPELVIQHDDLIGVALDDASPVSYGHTEDAEVILRDGEREHRSCLLAIVEVGDNFLVLADDLAEDVGVTEHRERIRTGVAVAAELNRDKRRGI